MGARTDMAYEDPAEAEETGRRRPGGPLVTLLLLLLTVPFVLVSVNRLIEVGGLRIAVGAAALTPYTLPLGLLLIVAGFALRRWAVALVAAVLTVIMAAVVIPRATPDARPFVQGESVRVLSLNMRYGSADPAVLVDLVRDRQVDVLSLQELTPAAVTALAEAGIESELPHQVIDPENGAPGSGLYSRHEAERIDAIPATHRQSAAAVTLPDGGEFEIVSVHPLWPIGDGTTDTWQRELASLPEARSADPIRVLAGDFNATLDHGPLRRLLNSGYQDAADQTGDGLRPTWPAGGTITAPPLTIDHVLVDNRCAVESFDVLDVPGSDHRAVLAEFVVPS
ncbi:endonuclease/exonuclease/phosphatase family protein [Actinoalloteichus hymeniacidonis]|uniref:Endonuclease/exonuclease/phosphatase domain-containing protein n=1 Tax=Actinoalloteichus hymeniacidonis TaxID=340345 RepID=A0AAC9HL08_9PSEU|nr:endonuclease/exonuclease/phosphatase family protein [Actinoalloteichus hymeniacidonis]AOS61189.1 hypothetical protein TL08_01750 [Actinoalloteichus hymeniacidonis]MBB5910810.1 endonuclease/exonuclease/phosphatase (EEP) superfamily protein YafD [Actinoalloteichus hymeniacidonis]